MSIFHRRVIVCQQWVELVTAYLDGALPRRLTKAIDRHLAACEHCTEYLAQMRRTIEVSGHLRDDDVPSDVLDALMRAFDEHRGPDHRDPDQRG
jgi:anti-sigma factor RsiW